MQVRYTQPEEHLFDEGDPGDAFFILAEGRVVMKKGINGQQQTIARYEAGTERPWFGEYSFWRNLPRNATAICLEPTIALVLKAEQFMRFLELVPAFETILSTSQTAMTTINRINKEKADIFAERDLDSDDDGEGPAFKHTAGFDRKSSRALPEILGQGIVTGGLAE
uniref:Cyclic nucleotide-binding domain-containing protein n=1 Tax=Prymnesium polylepis TaxID=72548 RepID=A0A7S4J1Q3_9EUKA